MDRFCESCGFPMRKKEDFGGGDIQNKYCTYCTDEKGILKSFEQKIEDMQNFMISRMGISEEKARIMAKEELMKHPAWKNN